MSGNRKRWVMLCGALLIGPLAQASGCESSEQIGSACPRGLCPQAITPRTDLCSITEAVAEVTVTLLPRVPGQSEPPTLDAICLPEPLPQSHDGRVACEVDWSIPQPPEDFALDGWINPRDCNDAPFLSHAEGEPANVCSVYPVTTEQRADGEEGWYYDTEPTECKSVGAARIAFTEGARPTNGVTIDLRCLSERARPAEADPQADGGAG
ncbi:MAG TPA: hypothetical protein VK509_14700, partial [Polyangiales bacterium]|nr:hypothetical protein [Polyangiales bacterium]